MLTPAEVRNIQFTVVKYRPGYSLRDVDDFLDRVEAGLEAPGSLTAADVRNARFATTRTGPAYDEREVDDFLTRVEAELADPAATQPAAAQPGSTSAPGQAPGSQGWGCLLFFGVVFWLGAIVVVMIGMSMGHATSARSAYTQAHGVPVSASVTTVTYPKDDGARILVRLDTPVGGQGTSTVYVPDGGTYPSGEQLEILVDPHDPSYSLERPGRGDRVVQLQRPAQLSLDASVTAVGSANPPHQPTPIVRLLGGLELGRISTELWLLMSS